MSDTPVALTDAALDLQGIAHGFFTRLGGVSEGIYHGLNIGVGSADDPARVRENRGRAMAALGLPAEALSTLYQIHSADVVHLTEPLGLEGLPKGDALVTDRPGLALGIATADCAPVLFADPTAQVIGACHSGWGGAFKGVVETTVEAMAALGADRDRIIAVLGPCIHQTSYEVGPEFKERFLERDPQTEQFFTPSDKDGHFRFDLPGFVLDRMKAAGVGRVGHVAEDTYSNPDRFYSYRRATHNQETDETGKVDYGRLLSTIALTQ